MLTILTINIIISFYNLNTYKPHNQVIDEFQGGILTANWKPRP